MKKSTSTVGFLTDENFSLQQRNWRKSYAKFFQVVSHSIDEESWEKLCVERIRELREWNSVAWPYNRQPFQWQTMTWDYLKKWIKDYSDNRSHIYGPSNFLQFVNFKIIKAIYDLRYFFKLHFGEEKLSDRLKDWYLDFY